MKMMTIPAAGLWFLSVVFAQGQPHPVQGKDYKALAAKIAVSVEPNVRANADWKEIVDWVGNRSNWEQVLKTMDEKLGISRDMPIKVMVMSASNASPAVGGGDRGGGLLYILAPAVMAWAKKDGFETAAFMKMCITHEISHCYQMNSRFEPLPPKHKWPWWLYEGMGDYAADYMVRLKDLPGKTVRDLDALSGTADKPVTGLEPYARGLLFYKHLAAVHGEEKLKKFVKAILIDETPYKKALQDATGKEWETFKKEERSWSESFVKKNPAK